MLLLPTEATIEAVNVSTDRHNSFHTYDKQLGCTQRNSVFNIDDVERDVEISNGKGSLRR